MFLVYIIGMPCIMIFIFICFSLGSPLLGESGTFYSEPGLKIDSSTSDYEYDRLMGEDQSSVDFYESDMVDPVSNAIDVFYQESERVVRKQKAPVTEITFQITGQSIKSTSSRQSASMRFSQFVQTER